MTPALVLRDRHVCGVETPIKKTWLDLEGDRLNGVVIYVDAPPAKRRLKRSRVEIDQVNCTYLPRVAAIASGSRVRFKNSDAVLHNVHLFGPNKKTVVNYAMPAKGQTTGWIRLKAPGRYRVGCDAGHTWMNAHLMVFDHPHFVVSTSSGAFSMTAPPGRHRFVSWHPDLGERVATVDVPDKGAVRLVVEY